MDNTVSVGGNGTYRRITNVADAVDAHDVVNLQTLEKKLNSIGIVNYDNTKHWLSTDFDQTFATKGVNSAAYGYMANAQADRSVAIGYNSTATAEGAVAIGSDSVADEKNTVSVGNKDGLNRKVTNVAAGENDTDAVNVSQLQEVKDILESNGITNGGQLSEKLSNAEKDLTDVQKILDSNGITASSNIGGRLDALNGLVGNNTINEGATNYTVMGNQNTVGGDQASAYGYNNQATGNNSTAIGNNNIANNTNSTATGSNNQATGENSSAYGYNNQATGDNSVAMGSGSNATGSSTIAIGKDATAADENSIAIGTSSNATGGGIAIGQGSKATESGTVSFGDGTDGGNRRLTNVADGKDKSDAATVGQVNKVEEIVKKAEESVGSVTGRITGVENRVAEVENRVNKVGAGAAALSSLRPLEFDPDDKVTYAVGYGHYKNANAIAMGAFLRPNDHLMISIGGAFAGGESMFNTGVAFSISNGKPSARLSKVALVKKINAQNQRMSEQDAEIAELKAAVEKLMVKNGMLPDVSHEITTSSDDGEKAVKE